MTDHLPRPRASVPVRNATSKGPNAHRERGGGGETDAVLEGSRDKREEMFEQQWLRRQIRTQSSWFSGLKIHSGSNFFYYIQ